MKKKLIAVAGLFMLFAAGQVQAQSTNFSLFKVAVYNQNSIAPPTAPATPNGYYFGAQFGTGDSAHIVQVGVALPSDGTIYLNPQSEFYYNFGSPYFADKDSLDAAYGAGVYVFFVAYDDASADYGNLTVSGDLYTTDVPAFDADTWTAMQQVDPAQPLNLEWNAFTPDPSVTAAYTFLRVQDFNRNSVPFEADFLTPDSTSTNLPAGSLLFGVTYTVSLFFSDRQDFPAAGFGGAPGTVGFDNLTQTTLTTMPPWLHICRADTNVLITWPELASNYVLSSTFQLAPNDGWFAITNPPAASGGTNMLLLPHDAPSQFFRLSPLTSPPAAFF